MATAADVLNEIMVLTNCTVQLANALTNEGNVTTPLIETEAIDNMNDCIIAMTAYLESVIPVAAP